MTWPRRILPAIAALILWGSTAPPGLAAPLAPADSAEMRRGLAMVDASTSEEAALREARRAGEPSAPFMIGTALGAWVNAARQLDYDLKTPSGDGDDSGAIAIDCFDERTAFDRLEARRKALHLTPTDVLASAAIGDVTVSDIWGSRLNGPSPRCR
jgi:hypothetical protein